MAAPRASGLETRRAHIRPPAQAMRYGAPMSSNARATPTPSIPDATAPTARTRALARPISSSRATTTDTALNGQAASSSPMPKGFERVTLARQTSAVRPPAAESTWEPSGPSVSTWGATAVSKATNANAVQTTGRVKRTWAKRNPPNCICGDGALPSSVNSRSQALAHSSMSSERPFDPCSLKNSSRSERYSAERSRSSASSRFPFISRPPLPISTVLARQRARRRVCAEQRIC